MGETTWLASIGNKKSCLPRPTTKGKDGELRKEGDSIDSCRPAFPVAGAGREDAEATRPNWLILMASCRYPHDPFAKVNPFETHISKAQVIEQL